MLKTQSKYMMDVRYNAIFISVREHQSTHCQYAGDGTIGGDILAIFMQPVHFSPPLLDVY